jgi:hypothetical protein
MANTKSREGGSSGNYLEKSHIYTDPNTNDEIEGEIS